MAAMYLDFCASTPVDKRVLDVMWDVYTNHIGNADSRTHIYGQSAKHIVEDARRTIAGILQVDPTEIIFTSGATESDNTAIIGLREYGEATGRKHIVTTAIEHKAVLESAKYMQKIGFDVDYIKPDESGRVKVADVLKKVRHDTLLVSVMHVNNETGVIQPVSEIGEALSKTDVLFHVDAAQAFGKLNRDLATLQYDMLSISGHKIHGPQGIGLLVLKRKNYRRPPVSALLHGGQQEYGFRPGTTPVALVAGFCEAARLMDDEYEKLLPTLQHQKENLLQQLTKSGCQFQINGDQKYVLPNILNISFTGVDSESIFAALRDEYAFSNGSACTSGSYAPSYVLKAMGFDDDRSSEALRISWWDEEIKPAALINHVKSTAVTW